MTNKEILEKSYKILSPYSDAQLWEFNSNLIHLNLLTKNLSKDSTILDAGCGIGILALAIKLAGYKIDGADKYQFKESIFNIYYVKDIKELQKKWSEFNLKIYNKDFLFDDLGMKYDVVISIATIEHQSNPKRFLNGLTKHLKNEGLLYIATPNISNFSNRLRFLLGRSPVHNLEEFFMAGDSFTGHWREYTLSELRRMFEFIGFERITSINVQSMGPKLKLRLKYIFSLLAFFLPGGKDTNIVFGNKVKNKN